jgi:hypothetical protein
MGAMATGSGEVYAALFENGLVKIGITRDIERRISQLDTLPIELLEIVTVFVETNLLRTEMDLHFIYKDVRVRGEYFKFCWKDWIKFFEYWNNFSSAKSSGLIDALAKYYPECNL